MYMKSLEMTGFKSFVDATKLEFPRGFTAVVGPNGCGKSNISDAIRWVIGEQSAKTLRGGRMEDLIFNGSEGRKALGMAEVSMTIANLPKASPERGLLLSEEVKVTRRFYRSGESEYFINKTPCRLRDIIDLFLDTGISPRAFSIIEQGHVNQLINAKPADRRFIIEEAAGIMKYKYRRNEALRKMDAAQANLVRVNDTLTELKRQLGSLKRQASRVAAYKAKKQELRRIVLSVYAMEYRDYHQGLEEITAELGKRREETERKDLALTSLANRIETEKTDRAFREKEIIGLKEARFELEGAVREAEARIGLMRKQIEEALHYRDEAAEERARLEEDLRGNTRTLAAREEELTKLKTAIASLEDTSDGKNESLREIKDELDQAKAEVEDLESGLQDVVRGLTEKDHSQVAHQARLTQLCQREEAIRGEDQELAGRLDQTLEDETNASQRFQALALEREKRSKRQKDILRELEKNRRELRSIESELEEGKDAQSRLAGRLSSLMEMRENFEGFQEGARNLLKERKAEGGPEGIRCALAEIIETAAEHETPVEAVLGDRLQGLLAENPRASRQALNFLKERKAGRCTFIPVAPRKIERHVSFPESGEGVIGRAVDLVSTSAEYRDTLADLLEDVLIVKDLESALALWDRGGFNCTLVTREGDILSPQGTLTGGSPAQGETGFLGKKRRISALRKDLSALGEKLAELNLRIHEKRNCLAGLEKQKAGVDEQLLSSERQYIHDEKDLQQTREIMERDRARLEALRREADNIRKEKEQSTAEIHALDGEISDLKAKKTKLDREIASAKAGLMNLLENLDTAREDANAFRYQLLEMKNRKERAFLDIEKMRNHAAAMQDRIEKWEANRKEAEEKKVRLEQATASTEKDMMDFSRKVGSIRSDIISKEEALAGQAERLAELEEKAGEMTREAEKEKAEIHEGELRKRELRLQRDNIAQRLREDLDIGIEELMNEYTESVNKEEYAAKASVLREQLARFSDVNMGALEEYNVVKQRHDFLSEQTADLTRSIADLRKAVEKINRTTSHRFSETFRKVNENFKMNFRRLFAGGRAEMILTQPDNILETGIDIIIQPPGKKLQNIIALSAGEKAMTALSVLFSVFMIKPSPFCLLDEVDAPLDEANVHRFKGILRELSDKTQFIIITHSQMTMTFAETLYGVTMEEKGVSKIVSVHLEQKGKDDPAQAEIPDPGFEVRGNENPDAAGEVKEVALAAVAGGEDS